LERRSLCRSRVNNKGRVNSLIGDFSLDEFRQEKVHEIDAKVGGGYKMSFTNFGTGKTAL